MKTSIFGLLFVQFLNIYCMKSRRQPKVIDGIPAKQSIFYWSVYIESPYSVCSGSLISTRWILTAAHCFLIKPKVATCYLGSAQKYQGLKVNCANYIIHPQFNERTFDKDLALIKLDKPIKCTKNIKPIRLPTRDLRTSKLKWKVGVLAGFGLCSDKIESDILRYTCLQVLPQEYCKIKLPNDRVCAKTTIRKPVPKNPCYGDGGSALAFYRGGKYYAVAVGSTLINSENCADEKCRVLLQSIYPNLGWIRKVTGIPEEDDDDEEEVIDWLLNILGLDY